MSTGSSGGGFDFDTQAGIAHVLASVRAADISAEQKNDLRDTIFLYTNGGRDQTVKIALEQKLANSAIVPTPVKAVPVPEPAPGSPMGHSRSAPTFAASAPQAAPVAPPAPTPQPAPTPAQAPAPQAAPAPASATPPPAPAAPPQAAPVAPPAPTPQPDPAPAPVAGQNPEVYLQRIREIKSLVNEKVGNPVNLVDIDNEVGREYMGSLLDAMKKINSGASAVSAMQRLETAFASVEKAIAAHNSAPATSEPTPAPATPPPAPQVPPVAPPAPTPQPDQVPAPTPEPIPTQVEKPTPASAPAASPQSSRVPLQDIPTPGPKVATPPAPVSTEIDEARWANDKIVVPPSAESTQKPEPVAAAPVAAQQPVPPPPAPKPAPEPVEQPKSAPEPTPEPEKKSVPIAPVPSLADKQPAKSEQKTEPEKPAANDPLFTPEIDNGLDQLLSEWSIFKKSGLFGTGPKGREHPLFKKISGLQIPLLLAGRFEGATQEIKQSITDYMNGWRYEQGIVYNQGETFERYLRRVIKHILDLQKKKVRS